MRLRYGIAWLLLLLATATPGHASPDTPDRSAQAARLWQLAAQEQAMLDQRGVILKEASLHRYVHAVVERLWEQAPSQLGTPTVRIITDTRLDAHAYPNGVIFLSTGILDVVENESQLAMILAHEMVHYARQHTIALYNHNQLATRHGARREGLTGGSAGVMAMRRMLAAAERQADREGLAMLRAAGYCDDEVLPLMAGLERCLRAQGYSNSLPPLAKRVERFNALLNPDGACQTGCAAASRDAMDYRERIAPALMANAEQAVRGGDWDQANRSVAKCLEAKPRNARAYYLKGEILRRQNKGGLATACIDAYEKALAVDPTFPPTHRALGEVHFKAGRFQMAKPYFEAFLSLAPEDMASTYITGYLQQCQN